MLAETETPSFLQSILMSEFMGMPIQSLLISFGLILGTILFRGIIIRFFFARLKTLASKTNTDFDDRFLDALESPSQTLVLVFGIYLATTSLPIDPQWRQILTFVFRGLSVILFFWALLRLVDVIVDAFASVAGQTDADSYLHGFAPLIKKAARIFLSIVAVVMIIDNLGYDIGGILATLGVGGVAFAIAAKDTIANLYGSVALALDRPFKVGDWIQVGNDVDGDVESIGLRSTKVRTWPKTVISIPNAILANEKINNFSRMPKRRVKQVIGVTYGTSPETINEIVDSIRTLLREDPGVNQEFILVSWTDFGESSLDILVYYFTTTIKWLEYMDVRQRINTKIAQTVATHGSSVAFPSRSIYIENKAGDSVINPA